MGYIVFLIVALVIAVDWAVKRSKRRAFKNNEDMPYAISSKNLPDKDKRTTDEEIVIYGEWAGNILQMLLFWPVVLVGVLIDFFTRKK